MNALFSTIQNVKRSFPFFKGPHIIPLLIAITGLIIIIQHKEVFESKKAQRNFKRIVGSIILIHQFLIGMWYFYSPMNFLQEALPLYICRIAATITAIAFLTNTKKLDFIVFHLGLMGGIIALLIPDTSGYLFPHIMYNQFFAIHTCLLWSSMFIYFVEGYRPNHIEFYKMCNFLIGFSIFVSMVNQVTGANYGYLEHPPLSSGFLDILPAGLIYKSAITAIMILLTYLLNIIFREQSMIKTKLINRFS